VAAPILPVDRPPSEGEWDDLQKALPDQPLHLALTVSGERDRSGWWGEGERTGWAETIEAVRLIADALGVPVEVRAASRAPWHPGRCAEIVVGDPSEPIGFAGELHPRACTAYGVPPRTAAAEVDLDALLRRARLIAPAPRFSTYPLAKEDVALVVDADVPAGAVAATLREGAGELLESVRLFDVYTGSQVGEGHKSLAFALRFRAPDRTLTEAETGAARDAAVALAGERHGAVQRA
jgi:phenylalanyl-tRNA synthetase beta chain